ncbi:facilitated trehalose transporter Tret1 [Halyomorpha halys]|uniref:facilitated trehalose transporter Tret1 n=1 Tax=Halyomorpha halys TaxID=286706 RepID=UPI0006D4D9F6|nr:facilitated trehalose transporter Tret1-like [Halyomorpha halys]
MISTNLKSIYRQRWMYFCALTVCSGNLSMSMTASWTSPTLTALLQDKQSGVHKKQAAILDALLPGGALLGGFCGWFLIDFFGRRSGNFVGGIFFLFSWTLLGSFPFLIVMYVGRILAGLAVGILYLSSGIYLAEVAPSSVRQVLFAMSQLFTNIGFLIEYLIGPYVSYGMLVYISAFPAILYTVGVAFVEESPYYLISKGHYYQAQESLEKLRGTKDVSIELKAIQDAVHHTQNGRFEVLLSKQNRRALAVAVGAMVVKQMTGGWALVSYSGPLLEQAGVPPHLGSAILGVAKLVTSVVTIFLTIKFGIKKLINVSLAGICGTLMVLLGTFILHQENINTDCIKWLPLVVLILFYVFTDIGIGPFPSFIGAELLSQQAKGLGTLIALSVGHVFGFFTMTLIIIADWIVSLSLFTAISAASIPFLYYYLVDTRGKSLVDLHGTLVQEVPRHV